MSAISFQSAFGVSASGKTWRKRCGVVRSGLTYHWRERVAGQPGTRVPQKPGLLAGTPLACPSPQKGSPSGRTRKAGIRDRGGLFALPATADDSKPGGYRTSLEQGSTGRDFCRPDWQTACISKNHRLHPFSVPTQYWFAKNELTHLPPIANPDQAPRRIRLRLVLSPAGRHRFVLHRQWMVTGVV
jgi:hypothetical protein